MHSYPASCLQEQTQYGVYQNCGQRNSFDAEIVLHVESKKGDEERLLQLHTAIRTFRHDAFIVAGRVIVVMLFLGNYTTAAASCTLVEPFLVDPMRLSLPKQSDPQLDLQSLSRFKAAWQRVL